MRSGGVELVEDLPDQLLQQILQRHDAESAAKFVQYHGEVASLPLHVEQQVAAGAAGRCIGDRANWQRIAGFELEQIKGMEHPDDFVERSPVYRQPTVAALREDRGDILQGIVLGNRHQIGPRSSSPLAPDAR